MEMSKKPWFSKTLVINLLVACFAMFGKSEIITANPEIVLAVFAMVNMLLRLVTKGKIEFFES